MARECYQGLRRGFFFLPNPKGEALLPSSSSPFGFLLEKHSLSPLPATASVMSEQQFSADLMDLAVPSFRPLFAIEALHSALEVACDCSLCLPALNWLRRG